MLASIILLYTAAKVRQTSQVRGQSEQAKRMIELPIGTKGIIINIGSNIDPIIPGEEDGSTHALAFEPVVSALIPPHPRLSVIPAAVSDASGLSTMHTYNIGGVSSSLANPASSESWNNDPTRDGKAIIVPTISLHHVLESIDQEIDIRMIKTDMQGYDFKAISSVGNFLARRGVKRLVTEVYLDNTRTYDGVENDLCLHWVKYMASVGYQLHHLIGEGGLDEPGERALERCRISHNETVGLRESDAFWRLIADTEEGDDLSKYRYPSVSSEMDSTNTEVSKIVGDMAGWKNVMVYVGNSTYGDPTEWYSQAGQDKTVCKIFEISAGDCTERFFLDLAANDAASLSNTKSLEDTYGWNGICIEANYEYLHGLAHRKCQVFASIVSSKTDDIVEFIEHPNDAPGWAGGIVSEETDNKPSVNGTRIRRHATSILDVLALAKAPRVIDYFSFDVEGSEDVILKADVLERYTFLVITVERPSTTLVKLLENFDYIYLKDHGDFGDKMYIHSSLSKIEDVRSKLS